MFLLQVEVAFLLPLLRIRVLLLNLVGQLSNRFPLLLLNLDSRLSFSQLFRARLPQHQQVTDIVVVFALIVHGGEVIDRFKADVYWCGE